MSANPAPTLDSSTLPAPRDGIAGAAPYGAPQLEVAHALNVNENPYGPSPELAAAIGRAATEAAVGLNRYPDREALGLRAELGEFLAAESGIPAPEAHAVWAANGSNEVMHQLLLAYGG
ncbi:MAG: histidinol-phosphate transaminase, partial [Brachybacterium sp.]|nr:histidinol-phosphate transaminase [Brachybacterium sp.]